MGAPALESSCAEVVTAALEQRRAAEAVAGSVALTLICMDTRPGDPECPILADDHTLTLARHPGGFSGAARRVSGAWAIDDRRGYEENSKAAHLNGLRLVTPLYEMGVTPVIHFGCTDNAVAEEAATLIADQNQDVLEVAQEMDRKLTRNAFARVAGAHALMLDMGHIVGPDTVVRDYVANGVPVATLHGPEWRGVSLVDNRGRRPVKAPPKRHHPGHDQVAIYVTDTGLVRPRLIRAARQGLSGDIRAATIGHVDTVHKAALVVLLDLPYAIVT
ncbi:MAG TPA: hypothetical protein VLE99_06230 [Candidatus Saccharimonadales bacterium]|nr:hypothetical protein [Candidatus Saccharimonadales bacterium]